MRTVGNVDCSVSVGVLFEEAASTITDTSLCCSPPPVSELDSNLSDDPTFSSGAPATQSLDVEMLLPSSQYQLWPFCSAPK
ncbi:MAG: hypothetical protein ACK55Z_22070, partial [bacterium]